MRANRLPHVLVQIRERLRRPRWLDTDVVLHLASEVVVGECEHPAVGVMDQDDLRRSKQALRDRERADRVIGDDPPPGVADDMTVALVESRSACGLSRASMQATTATFIAGGSDRSPLSKASRRWSTE
jgi:hypothetical protein